PHKNNQSWVVHRNELKSNQTKNIGSFRMRRKIWLIYFKSPDHHINAVRNGMVASIRQPKVCSLSKGCINGVKRYKTPNTTDASTDNAIPLYMLLTYKTSGIL